MKENYMLSCGEAKRLYGVVKDLPIYDYHCHLSPKDIWEDKPFTDIGEMWLGGDHYKWRLMRAAGIDEELITGNAGWKEKFLAYAEAVSLAAGNPLYHWTEMELSMYFGIDTPLSPETAEEIYEKANAVIAEKKYSPRKLIEMSNVALVATTDDPADTLEYHKLIASDKTVGFKVVPSFRPDNLLRLDVKGYADYVKKFSKAAGIEVKDLASLDEAIEKRVAFFAENGCRFTDVGIPFFPSRKGSDEEANAAFTKALNGEKLADGEFDAFLYRMFVFLGGLYKKYGLSMQWHIAVRRNTNSLLFNAKGADMGGDSVNDPVPTGDIAAVLDEINTRTGLPKTIIYSLNPSGNDALASVAYSFPNVILGTAWWFCDHKDGIKEVIRIIARTGHIAGFIGMLTDSRSFLSYARHDYFRRIFCSVLGEWVESGEYSGNADEIARRVCCENTKKLCERS